MAVKFATNVPQTLCFPYGDFKEIDSQFGQQYLYTVQLNGQQDKLYATPTLHQRLQAAGIIGPGVILTVTKVEGEGNSKSWVIQPNGNGQSVPDDPTTRRDAKPCVSSENVPPPHPDFASIQRLMNDCLQASWAACSTLGGETQFTSKDVRKIGITMFLESCRKGILSEPHQQT